ncbi:MAG: hypothetical protein ACP5PR_00330 [Minisyncoccia bacterium]
MDSVFFSRIPEPRKWQATKGEKEEEMDVKQYKCSSCGTVIIPWPQDGHEGKKILCPNCFGWATRIKDLKEDKLELQVKAFWSGIEVLATPEAKTKASIGVDCAIGGGNMVRHFLKANDKTEEDAIRLSLVRILKGKKVLFKNQGNNKIIIRFFEKI